MNATSFLSEKEYGEIVQIITKPLAEAEDIQRIRKTVKEQGSEYEMTFHTGSLRSQYFKWKYCSFMFSYRYKDKTFTDGYAIGGYQGLLYREEMSYQEWYETFNESLKKFPDYEEAIQLSLF